MVSDLDVIIKYINKPTMIVTKHFKTDIRLIIQKVQILEILYIYDEQSDLHA